MLRAVADAREAFSVDSGSLMLDAVIYAPSNDADSYLATLECVEAFVEGCKKFNENKNVWFFFTKKCRLLENICNYHIELTLMCGDFCYP